MTTKTVDLEIVADRQHDAGEVVASETRVSP
jgi:hypothetical protein